MDKSSIHFAKGVSGSIREAVMDSLQVHNVALSEKYLGMPSDVGVSTNGAFKYLKDRVWKRVQGWLEQTLSSGGKEVLIKSVAQAIPTFSMSCFRLPRGLCQHIDNLLRSFWWGSKEGKRKTCWVAWEEMAKPKYMGGMGFRDIEIFNLALLARQAWRILQDPDSLSARVLKAVYFPSNLFLEADLGPSPSRVWRAIVDGKEVLKQGLIRRIGTGEDTEVWHSNWLPRDGQLRPICCISDTPPGKVSELINPLTFTWDLQAVDTHFLPMDGELIRSILLSGRRQEDFWAWHYEKSGVFSVRSAYRMLVTTRERRSNWIEHNPGRSDVEADQKDWTDLWSVKVPSKIRVFLWRLAKHSIPTGDVRHRRNMAQTSNCSICGGQDSWKHSLLECNMARCVWALQCDELVDFISQAQDDNARGWIHEAIAGLAHDKLVRLVVTLWAIWHARRKAIHENIFQSPLSTHSFIERFIADLETAMPTVERKGDAGAGCAPAAAPKWIPPPQGLMKVNVDAALSKNSDIVAMAAVARDGAGAFMGASALVMKGISDPETAEVLACREGLALAADLMIRRVRIATDCACAVRSMAGPGMGRYNHVIREMKAGMANFEKAEVVHEWRVSNTDAHALARSSICESLGRHVWFFDPPDGVCTSYAV